MKVYILFSFILFYILFSISKEDIETMLISEYKLIVLAASGVLYLLSLRLTDTKVDIHDLIINNFLSMLIIFHMMSSISYISYKLLGINALGLGDIKLSSISSIWLGLELCFISLIISFLLSAIYSLHGKMTKRFYTFYQYPFAPFLSIGIFCSWILDKI